MQVYLEARVPKTSSAHRHCRLESFCASGKFLRVFTKLAIKWSLNIKVSKQSGKFPNSLESFRTVWKVSEQCGKFPDSLGSFPWHVCHVCESNVCIHGTFMSQKLFTHFWRIFVAKAIYALRPESFCAWNYADRKVWTFCVSGLWISLPRKLVLFQLQTSQIKK